MTENAKLIKKNFDDLFRLINETENMQGGNEKNAAANLKKAVYKANRILDILNAVIKERKKTADGKPYDDSETSAGGSIEMITMSWLHIRLDSILPNDKNNKEMRETSNTISCLLNYFNSYHGFLPQYERAFLAIVEHISSDTMSSFDHDNKGYRAIPNALKGRIFEDDNQFTMSLGLFSTHNENDPHCDIYVIPQEDLAEFSTYYLRF